MDNLKFKKKKLNQQQDSCKSKKSFSSEAMANEVIDVQNLTGTQTAYKCKLCKNFHITTTDKRIKKKRDISRRKKDSELKNHLRNKRTHKKLGHKRRKDH